MKQCTECKNSLPITEFYKHTGMSDGYLNKFKVCTIKATTNYRLKNFAKVKAYQAVYQKTDSAKKYRAVYQSGRVKTEARKTYLSAYQVAYQKTENFRVSVKKWQLNNPLEYAAHKKLTHAVASGKIVKQPCEICGSTYRIHGHHDDYSKPLNVRWLCSQHHKQWHKENKVVKNANI